MTDDTLALQAALDAAEEAAVPGTGGREVFLPAGRYLVSSTLLFSSDAVLAGEGGQTTDLRTATDITLLRAKNAGLGATYRVVFRDLFLAANLGANTTGVALDLTDVSSAHVENVTAYRYGTGFKIGKQAVSAIYNRFVSCEVATCGTGWDLGAEANNTWVMASRVNDTPNPFVLNGCNSCSIVNTACETAVLNGFDLGPTSPVSDTCLIANRVEGASTAFRVHPGTQRTTIISPHMAAVGQRLIDEGSDTTFLFADDMRLPGPDVRTGVETHSPGAGTYNNYALGGGAATVRMIPAVGGTTFRGFTDGRAGRRLRVINVGATSLVLAHQNSGAALPNRFISPTAADVVVAANESVDLEYDAISERWRILRAP